MKYVVRGRRAAAAAGLAAAMSAGPLLGVVLAASASATEEPLAGTTSTVDQTTGQSEKGAEESATEPSGKGQDKSRDKSQDKGGKDKGPVPGKLRGGTIVQSGWWSRLNETPPENPIAVPPAPPAPGAPKDTLPVAVTAGELQRISAIEFSLDGEPGSQVDKVLLAIKESEASGSQLNGDTAAVVACPITESSFVGQENGRWQNKPEYDCDAGFVAGERDDEGVWRFDLTTLANDWLASDRTAAPAVVLVPAAAEGQSAPQSFQVGYAGPKADGVGLLAVVTPLLDGGDEGDGGTDGGSTDGGSSSGGGTPGSPSGDSSGGLGSVGGVDSSGSVGSAPGGEVAPIDAAPVADEAPVSGEEAPAATTTATPVAASPLPWHAGIPRIAIILLPLALGLAYLAMVAMGPDAQPTGELGRRGVSRALDRMRAAGAQLTTSLPTKGARP